MLLIHHALPQHDDSFEKFVYPVLTQAFAEGAIVNERSGHNDHVSIDWAEARSGDHDVRVGMYRAGELTMGLLVEIDGAEEPFWIRHSYGELCKLADGSVDIPVPISVTRKEKRTLKAILPDLRMAHSE